MKRREFINKTLGASALASTLPLGKLSASVNKQASNSASQEKKNYDVIVIGVGSMGSATCYHLAKQGVSVLGLEQFDIPHELGSHAGQSRIIRKAYFEHPDYVPLLEKSYQNWKALEDETGDQLYFKTGLLYFGKSDHALIKGLRLSARKYSIEVNDLTAQQVVSQFPQFRIPLGYDRLMEPEAGFIIPERAVLLYTERAIQNGAVIHTKEKTLEWKKTGDTITVKTNKNSYQCNKLIITAGPWAGKVIPNLSKNLTGSRQMIAWVKPKKWNSFEGLMSYLLLLSIFIQCTQRKNDASEDERLIREGRQSSNDAIAKQDTTALAEVWTNDYHIISSRNYEISGMENNRHNFAKEFASKKELLYVRTTHKVEVFANWKMASEQGTWTGQWLEPDGLVKLTGTYVAKWHKVDEQWKIRAEIFVPLSCTGSSFCKKTPF